jgi:hypothetical protein
VGFELVDIEAPEGDEDIVLVHSSSRQLTGKLRAAFPDALLVDRRNDGAAPKRERRRGGDGI